MDRPLQVAGSSCQDRDPENETLLTSTNRVAIPGGYLHGRLAELLEIGHYDPFSDALTHSYFIHLGYPRGLPASSNTWAFSSVVSVKQIGLL